MWFWDEESDVLWSFGEESRQRVGYVLAEDEPPTDYTTGGLEFSVSDDYPHVLSIKSTEMGEHFALNQLRELGAIFELWEFK